jgi:hypothetical protein
MINHPNENLPWNPVVEQQEVQPHDEDAPEVQCKNYFGPA